MSKDQTAIPFRDNAKEALADEAMREAMRSSTATFSNNRAKGFAEVPDREAWRDRASEIKLHTLDNLHQYIDDFAAAATRAGAVVYRAKDAQSSRQIIGDILKDRGSRKVVKVKSMVSEEVHLNDYLEKQGHEVVETDLGEYIVQLAKERPSHILAPALHKNRYQVGELFTEKLGVPYSDDPEVLTKIARKALREKFLDAEAAISGANFAVAETGSLVLFTNEGNGRMSTTIPPLHIAILSIEKMIPKMADLSAFIRLLPRSATGQKLSSYLSIITGTRKPGEVTGARELHIVLLDNGRSDILEGECREILKCVRCGACMNVCPVYGTIGGHAYGSTYPGPMGIVLTTLLEGLERAHPLLDATTLCGACVDVCPVKVPLLKLLYKLRERRAEQGFTPASERMGMKAFGATVGSPSLFSRGMGMARFFWPIMKTVSGKGAIERVPKPVKETFRRRMS
jgi:L-lactate dehydrogenase complex protein LldF